MAIVNNIVLNGETLDIEDTINKEVFTQDINNLNTEVANIKTAIDGKPTAAISYKADTEELTITTGNITAPASPTSDVPTPLAEGGEIATVNLDNTTYTLKSSGSGNIGRIGRVSGNWVRTSAGVDSRSFPYSALNTNTTDFNNGNVVIIPVIRSIINGNPNIINPYIRLTVNGYDAENFKLSLWANFSASLVEPIQIVYDVLAIKIV